MAFCANDELVRFEADHATSILCHEVEKLVATNPVLKRIRIELGHRGFLLREKLQGGPVRGHERYKDVRDVPIVLAAACHSRLPLRATRWSCNQSILPHFRCIAVRARVRRSFTRSRAS